MFCYDSITATRRHPNCLLWGHDRGHVASQLARKSRMRVIRTIADAAHKRQGSQSPVTLDDIKRQRLRFGDRPTRRWQPQHKDTDPQFLEQLQQLRTAEDAATLISTEWRQLLDRIDAFLGRKLYEYFNWRQDTSKDLLVTFGVFAMLVLAAGAVRRWAVDEPADRAAGNLWADVYQVCQWVFGQEFPGPDAALGQQVLSVGTAVIGLAAFAMVLALVEQVVLEGLEANVKRGSKVFESGHILVLGWCVSQRDMEVVRKVAQQICVAHAPEGGTTVVIMTQCSKLEMEGMFWRCLPESKRYKTKLVFRQGSPLVPSDLLLVGACRAAATIVVSDQSRSAAEADAQAVRCAILLDELDGGDDDCPDTPFLTAMAAAASSDDQLLATQLDLSLLGRHVVVELKTANALPLLKYACSSRVMALPTSQLNAQRLAKMVKRPVISIISQTLFNFENAVSLYVHYYPHLVGTRFGDLAYLFPDGIVLGMVDRATGKAKMAPSRDCIVQPTHALVVCRPTSISSHSYVPLEAPPSQEQLRLQEALAAWTGLPGRTISGMDRLPAMTVSRVDASSTADRRPGPAGAAASSSASNPPAGAKWSSTVSQVDLLRQQAEACSLYSDGQPSLASSECVTGGQPQAGQASTSNNIVPIQQLSGSRVGSDSGPWDTSSLVGAVAHVASQELQFDTIKSSAPAQAAHTSTAHLPSYTTANSAAVDDPAVADAPTDRGCLPAGCSSSTSSSSSHMADALRTADWPVLSGMHPHADSGILWRLAKRPGQQLRQTRPLGTVSNGGSSTRGWPSAFATDNSVENGAGLRMLPLSSRAAPLHGAVNDAAVLVPPEYFEVDECAEKVCVLGWGPNSLMLDLIKELDHGLSALPKGSEVVFVNMHDPHDSLGQALQHVTLENVQVRHVAANPLQRSSLAAALDVPAFRCALVLCDELWVDPDNNDANGLDSLDEPSVLRLDSLVMVAQLNVRKLLEDSKMPAINIICQKVATEGLTRFEDRHRLPLGISVNLNSFAAKMLAQIAANPLMLVPVTRLGEDAMLTIVDSSCYAALGETLNFWQLMAHCQQVGDVLLGYYEIPEHLDEPLNTVVNPIGMQVRCTPRVWNEGDGRLKFILLCHKHYYHSSTSGSHDDLELENTKQAGWVAARQRTPHASTQGSPHHSHHSHPNSWTDGQ